MKNKIYKALKFLGRKGFFWLLIGVFSGLSFSVIEIIFAGFIQMILVIIGTKAGPIRVSHFEIPTMDVYHFCFWLVILGFIRSFMLFLIQQSAIVANEVIGTRLRLLAFYDAFKLKQGFLSLSDMQTKLGEIFPKATVFVHYFTVLIPTALSTLMMLVSMFIIAPKITVSGLAGILVIGLVILKMNKTVRKIADHLPREFRHLTTRIVQVMRNFLLLRALRTVDREHEQLVDSSLRYSTHSIRANFFAQAAATLPVAFGMLLVSFLLIKHVRNPELSPDDFIAFLYLFMRFVNSLSGIASSYGVVNMHMPSFKLAAKYFFSFDFATIHAAVTPATQLSALGAQKRLRQDTSRHDPIPMNQSEKITPPEVSVSGVSFQYAGTQDVIVKNLSFNLPSGQMIGIQGRSGAGKSTLLGLVLGVLEPTSGRILINGKKPSEILSKSEFRIGYVGPDPFLIEGTLRQNLLYGVRFQVSDDDCKKALELAQLGGWLAQNSQGLDYPLSEIGEGLSTGQKQRLSLARAFLVRPHLMVLDEISANLDLKTESEVAEVLKNLKGISTCLLVSHREGILKYADQVIHL